MEYPALFERAEEGGFVIAFPNFESGITQGDDETEAGEMAADALSTKIQAHIRKGEELPRASKPRGPEVPHNSPGRVTKA
jgi:antitoxin HicB